MVVVLWLLYYDINRCRNRGKKWDGCCIMISIGAEFCPMIRTAYRGFLPQLNSTVVTRRLSF